VSVAQREVKHPKCQSLELSFFVERTKDGGCAKSEFIIPFDGDN
jgi:hypothetical protein